MPMNRKHLSLDFPDKNEIFQCHYRTILAKQDKIKEHVILKCQFFKIYICQLCWLVIRGSEINSKCFFLKFCYPSSSTWEVLRWGFKFNVGFNACYLLISKCFMF